MPSVVQHGNARIAIGHAPRLTKVSERLHRTQAWSRADRCHEVERRRGSNLHGAWAQRPAGEVRRGDGVRR